jgi:hypothetical protein
MKKLAWIAITSVALIALVASAAEQQDRPVGVEERDWVQISDRFGFVVDEAPVAPRGITDSRQLLIVPPDSVSSVLMPPTKGYFVVKTPMGWRRVVLAADAPGFMPLKAP